MTTKTDKERSDGLVGEVGTNGNGDRPPRYIELALRFNLDTGTLDFNVKPADAIRDRITMYGLLELVRDLIYRQQLPNEMAALAQAAAQQPQIVVAPDGAVPRFPGRG